MQAPAHADAVPLEDPGQGPDVLVADGEHPAVEVAPLDLDHPDVAGEQLPLGGVERVEAPEVDGDRAGHDGTGRRRLPASSAVAAIGLPSRGSSWSTGTP